MEPATSLAEALFGGGAASSRPLRMPDPVWQEIRFDSPPGYLALRRGETVLEALDAEDTKGNNGMTGELTLTNLRLMWVDARKTRRTSISFGWACVISLASAPTHSRLKGRCLSLHLMTRQGQQRFEFVFTTVTGHQGPNLDAAVRGVLAAFEASRPYRELRLRGALFGPNVAGSGDGAAGLRLLPREVAYSRVAGVWNLSADGGTQGALTITNVRLVWASAAAEAFNASIPYLQVKCARLAHSSKFGPTLVVEMVGSGGAVLGFKVEPRETLEYVHKELGSLLQAFAADPVFGVEWDASAAIVVAADNNTPDDAQDSDIIETHSQADAWAAVGGCYAPADGGGAGGDPVYCAQLGLAMEPLKEGTSVAQLWSIL